MESGCLNILVVDDTELVVDRLFEMLSELTCVDKLFKANSYAEAVAVLEKNIPDIVLLDIQMPGKNGIQLLQFIRNTYPDVCTVMFTNRVSDYYREICENIGANYFIDKSTEFEKIPGIVQDLMPV